MARAVGASALCVTLLAFWESLHWSVALVSPFRPQYAWLAGAALVVGSVTRAGWPWVLASAVALGVNVGVLWPWLAPPADAPPAGATFRLMTWNAWANNEAPDEVARAIAHSGADLALVCEAPSPWRRGGPPEIPGYEAVAFDQYVVAVRAGGPVTLDEAKLVRPPLACEARLWFDGLPLRALSVHCSRPTSPGGRRQQDHRLRRIGDWLALDPTPAVIVGDFNSTPWCAALSAFLAREPLVDSSRGRGVAFTFPAQPPLAGRLVGVPIDHCFFTRELACRRRWVGDAHSSNHRPVFVELGWRRR